MSFYKQKPCDSGTTEFRSSFSGLKVRSDMKSVDKSAHCLCAWLLINVSHYRTYIHLHWNWTWRAQRSCRISVVTICHPSSKNWSQKWTKRRWATKTKKTKIRRLVALSSFCRIVMHGFISLLNALLDSLICVIAKVATMTWSLLIRVLDLGYPLNYAPVYVMHV